MTITIRKSVNSQYYFTIRSSNGNKLATSETYWNKADAKSAAQSIKNQAAGATITDLA